MCNDWLDLGNKMLTSPNYPWPYDPLTFCKWTLTSSEEYYITLDFSMIDFSAYHDGDYITIYDIDNDGNYILISKLTGSDVGPKSQTASSNWNKKVISSSSNQMVVEFKSDDALEYSGFHVSIDYNPMPSQECATWLDMNDKTIKSPNYPNLYDNNILCKWLITVQHGFHIALDFQEFDVRSFFYSLQKCLLLLIFLILCYCFFTVRK